MTEPSPAFGAANNPTHLYCRRSRRDRRDHARGVPAGSSAHLGGLTHPAPKRQKPLAHLQSFQRELGHLPRPLLRLELAPVVAQPPELVVAQPLGLELGPKITEIRSRIAWRRRLSFRLCLNLKSLKFSLKGSSFQTRKFSTTSSRHDQSWACFHGHEGLFVG